MFKPLGTTRERAQNTSLGGTGIGLEVTNDMFPVEIVLVRSFTMLINVALVLKKQYHYVESTTDSDSQTQGFSLGLLGRKLTPR